MAFAQPLFLIALVALAIPVIIHLFNFRRYKKVYFTNVRFIREISQESKNRSQLKHLLILLSRLLAISALVLAFSQPFIPSPFQKKKISGKRAVSIYIDNSFSMEALSPNGSLLDIAKSRALEIAGAYQPSDLFQLLTCDFEGRHQRFVTPDEFRALVEEVKVSPVRRTLPQVLRRQQDMLSAIPGNNRSAFVISDFQKSTLSPGRITTDSSVSYYFIPVTGSSGDNLFIDSVWFDTPLQMPGATLRLRARIRSTSPEPFEKIPLKLFVNNKQKALSSASTSSFGETEIIIPYTCEEAGIQNCRIEITDYPVTWDDTLYYSYLVRPSVPVMCIGQGIENPFFGALFLFDSTIAFRNIPISRLDFSAFQRYPVIILDGVESYSSGLVQELSRFVNRGGTLLVFPPSTGETSQVNGLLRLLSVQGYSGIDTVMQKISGVNTEHVVFRDVFEKSASGKISLPENTDLPLIRKHFVIGSSVISSKEDLLILQGGDPFLSVFTSGSGKVYLCAVPADDIWSNFPRHSLFVPVLYNIALFSQPAQALYYPLNGNEVIRVSNADSLPRGEVFKIRRLDSGYEFIPGIRSSGGEVVLDPYDLVSRAGSYLIMEGSTIVQGVAFNYDRKESDLTRYSPGEVEKIMAGSRINYFAMIPPKTISIANQISSLEKGTPLWKLFIILTLLFFGIEILLVRMVKG